MIFPTIKDLLMNKIDEKSIITFCDVLLNGCDWLYDDRYKYYEATQYIKNCEDLPELCEAIGLSYRIQFGALVIDFDNSSARAYTLIQIIGKSHHANEIIEILRYALISYNNMEINTEKVIYLPTEYQVYKNILMVLLYMFNIFYADKDKNIVLIKR